jgi:hypothetical protein
LFFDTVVVDRPIVPFVPFVPCVRPVVVRVVAS